MSSKQLSTKSLQIYYSNYVYCFHSIHGSLSVLEHKKFKEAKKFKPKTI